MSTRRSMFFPTLAMAMLMASCGSDSSEPGGQASSASATKTGFPEAAYAKVKAGISSGPNVLNEKMLKGIVSIAPAVSKVAITAVQAMDREEYLGQLDALAKKIDMRDSQELLTGAKALQKAGFVMEFLLDLEKKFADGDEKLIPNMYYDNCSKSIKSNKLTRADLEFMQKNMGIINLVKNDLETIAGTCKLLLNK